MLKQAVERRESWQPFRHRLGWFRLERYLPNVFDGRLGDHDNLRHHPERAAHGDVQYGDGNVHDYDGLYQRRPVHDVSQHLPVSRRLCGRSAGGSRIVEADHDNDDQCRGVRIGHVDGHVHIRFAAAVDDGIEWRVGDHVHRMGRFRPPDHWQLRGHDNRERVQRCGPDLDADADQWQHDIDDNHDVRRERDSTDDRKHKPRDRIDDDVQQHRDSASLQIDPSGVRTTGLRRNSRACRGVPPKAKGHEKARQFTCWNWRAGTVALRKRDAPPAELRTRPREPCDSQGSGPRSAGGPPGRRSCRVCRRPI